MNESRKISGVCAIAFMLAIFLTVVGKSANAQIQTTSLNKSIVYASLDGYHVTTSNKKKFLNTRDKKPLQRLNPLLYVSGGLLWIYQSVFSEQIQAECTYVVSCSRYTKKCIERYGFIKGSLLGIDQLSACHPSVSHETPLYKIASSEKIDNRDED